MTPVARRTDPGTSWAAANSVTRVRASQWRIYIILLDSDGLTDEELIRAVASGGWQMSDSGVRSRRSELVHLGWVHDTGTRRLTAAGRHTIVWAADLGGRP